MSVSAGDLQLYNAASRPGDDASPSGGAVDLTMRPIFAQFGANAVLTFQSASAADTQNVTITGRDAAGRPVVEVLALTGVSEVASVTTFSRILSFVLASAAAGAITVRQGLGGTTIHTIAIGEVGGAGLFIGSSSAGAQTVRYEKVFWKNTNGTWALLAAVVQLLVDATGDLAIGLATAKNDSGSVANRLTAPAGVAFVALGVPAAVPTNELDAGDVIGVWVRQTLGALEVPHDVTLTLQCSGQTA